jgi:diguanylate cyclase (GGDEF)-like protein
VLGCSAKLLILVPLLIYFTEVLSFKHRFMPLVCILSIMNFIVQCIIYLFGAADFGNMEQVNLALWLLTGLYVAVILTVEFVKYHRYELGLRMAAMWVLAVLAVTNVICAWLFPSVSTMLFDSICTFIYLVLLVVDVLCLIAESQKAYIEERFSSQMALLDGLTRMPNRSSYNRHLEQLSAEPDPEQTVAVVDIRIDLDELIKMNQKQGYNAGDELVVGCSKCVTRAFRTLGRSYRISGNEFVVVAEQHTEEDVQAAVEVFWLTIGDFNNEHINPLHPRLGYQIGTGVTTREQVTEMLDKAVALAGDHAAWTGGAISSS